MKIIIDCENENIDQDYIKAVVGQIIDIRYLTWDYEFSISVINSGETKNEENKAEAKPVWKCQLPKAINKINNNMPVWRSQQILMGKTNENARFKVCEVEGLKDTLIIPSEKP